VRNNTCQDRLETYAAGISIMCEGIKESTEFEKAHDLLKQAEAIYFLGFGYNPGNLDRLKILSFITDKSVYGTAYGLRVGELLTVRRYLCGFR